ncbi:MAG: hypothetical protein ABGX27_01580 [Desulfurobacteriaceae bacterium]
MKLWFPERPVAVNKIAPVWRDVGISVKGWDSDKIYNKNKKYLYVFAVDTIPLNTNSVKWKLRVGYETGYDRNSKLTYTDYSATTVKRNLFDIETRVDIKPVGLSIEGGYLFDNPTNAKDENGNEVSLGNAKGFYVQGDYQAPKLKKLHIVGRYSWVDPNTEIEDKNDVSYTSLGFYYLMNKWQAAIRGAYIWANEREVSEIDNNLAVVEFQLLF